MRLLAKLLLALVAVVLLAVLSVAVLANQAAQREVSRFMTGSGMTTESGLALELAGFYRAQGNWDGVEAILQPGHGMGHMMGQRLVLANAGGQVVADTSGQLDGQVLAPDVLAEGVHIEVDGQRVGTLLARGGMIGGPPGVPAAQLQVLARVNRAIWLAALTAGAAAVVVGAGLAYGLLRPIRRLTAATAAIARGQLSQRVEVASGDELGDLAASFNQMAASLEKAERLRRDMTADIAHELRNPIAVLQGNLEAVLDGVLPATPETLQPLLAQTQLLARLVDDLRTLALADAGQLSLHREPTDPAALAQTVLAQFAPQAEAKSITLAADLEPGLPPTALDAQRITQVLSNLLSNAIRHTPPGGIVTCRVARQRPPQPAVQPPLAGNGSTGIMVTVADSGPGIPREALPHIFERFYRADSARARADGGTGLGLTIARKLVEAHGGQIWVESEEGKGTAVAFYLPTTKA